MAQRVPGAQQDLFTALNMFKQGMQQYSMTRALNNANAQVEDIRQQDLKIEDQRKQIRQVANNLTVQMLGAGASPGQVAAAGSAFAPPEPTDFEQRKQLQTQQFAHQQDMLKQKQAHDLSILGAKAATDKGAGLKTGEVNKLQEMDTQLLSAKQILARVEEDPGLSNLAQRVPGVAGAREIVDEKFASFRSEVGRFFDAYRKAVTGAQASVKELQILEKRMPTVGDRPAQFKAKLKSVLALGEKVRKRYLKSLKAGGRDISGFDSDPLGGIELPTPPTLPEVPENASTVQRTQSARKWLVPKGSKF